MVIYRFLAACLLIWKKIQKEKINWLIKIPRISITLWARDSRWPRDFFTTLSCRAICNRLWQEDPNKNKRLLGSKKMMMTNQLIYTVALTKTRLDSSATCRKKRTTGLTMASKSTACTLMGGKCSLKKASGTQVCNVYDYETQNGPKVSLT